MISSLKPFSASACLLVFNYTVVGGFCLKRPYLYIYEKKICQAVSGYKT